MKNHPVYRPLRTSLAVLALGVSGLLVYQQFNSPAKPIAISTRAKHHSAQTSARQTKVASQKNGDPSAPLTSARQQDIPQIHTDSSIFQEFNDWAGNYVNASPAEKRQMFSRGDTIVKQRHEKMATLIKEDPALALAESDALPPLVRDALPDSLKQQLEEPVNARGDLTVIAYTGGKAPYKRFTTFGTDEYTVYSENEDESLYKELNRSLLGIKLTANATTTYPDGQTYPRVDRLMALRKERVRVLNAEQSLVALKTLGKKDKTVCSVSAKLIAESTTPVVIETGGASKTMCQPAHATSWANSEEGMKLAGLAPGEYAAGGPGEGAGAGTFFPVPEGHSTGNKTFLCVRFRCSDQLETTYNELDTVVPEMIAKLNKWSYGRMKFTSYTLSPLILLPQTAKDYRKGLANAQDDAWAIAKKRYNIDNYSFSAVCVRDLWLFTGSAGIVATTLQINAPDQNVFHHELGHCFGLPHANLWRPTTTDPIGPGNNEDYGASYDTMGLGASWSPYNTMSRFYIRWLTMAETHNLDSRISDTYRIYDPDILTLNSARKYTIRIPRSDGNYYFVEFRPRLTALAGNTAVDSTTLDGIRIFRTNGAQLIDVTPLSAGGSFDAALLAGNEFYDAGEDISVKAIAKGGTGENQYFDVEVLFASKKAAISGLTYTLRCLEGNLVAGVSNYSTLNNAPIMQQSLQSDANQKWNLMKVDSDYYKIVNVNSGKVLEVAMSLVNGKWIRQWDYVGASNQKWRILSTANNTFRLINLYSGLALSSAYPRTQSGIQLEQYTYTGWSGQKWFLDAVSPLNSGSNYSITARHSGKVLDVSGSSVANGAYLHQWTAVSSSPFQKWTASTQGGAQLAFTNLGSQKVLEVNGYAMGDGGRIQQWQWAGHNWQKWRLEVSDQDSGGFWYKIVNVGSSKVADVSGVSVSNGAMVQQYSSWGGANQQWRVSKVQ
jgi:Ricin-type beta-trefoil lectin domain-like